MGEHSQEYIKALQSQHWQQLKKTWYKTFGKRCSWCGMPETEDSPLHLHHKHYDTLGSETLNDVELVCVHCHKRADKKRESEASGRRYSKAVSTFGMKKYGEDYWHIPYDRLEMEFDEWLERKERSEPF